MQCLQLSFSRFRPSRSNPSIHDAPRPKPSRSTRLSARANLQGLVQPQSKDWDPRFPHWPGTQSVAEWWQPAEAAITSLSFANWPYTPASPLPPVQDIRATPFSFITEQSELSQLAAALSEETEFAVDTKVHKFLKYQPCICLLQISTRRADYVVDVLGLERAIGPLLGPAFADGKVLKVMHGADQHDLALLQRCFGVHVCNLFDTAWAEWVLNPGILQESQVYGQNLKGLIQQYTPYTKSDYLTSKKKYGQANWRKRPLTQGLKQYARSDPHFLLAIKDRQLVALNARSQDPGALPDPLAARMTFPKGQPHGLASAVLEACRQLCLVPYAPPTIADGAAHILKHYTGMREKDPLEYAQLTSIVTELTAWRDEIARREDKSIGFVIRSKQLRQLARGLPEALPEALYTRPSHRGISNWHGDLNALQQILERARAAQGSRP